MIHEDLQQQLDSLKAYIPGIETDDHPQHKEYLKLQNFLIELSKYNKSQWGDESAITHARIAASEYPLD